MSGRWRLLLQAPGCRTFHARGRIRPRLYGRRDHPELLFAACRNRKACYRQCERVAANSFGVGAGSQEFCPDCRRYDQRKAAPLFLQPLPFARPLPVRSSCCLTSSKLWRTTGRSMTPRPSVRPSASAASKEGEEHHADKTCGQLRNNANIHTARLLTVSRARYQTGPVASQFQLTFRGSSCSPRSVLSRRFNSSETRLRKSPSRPPRCARRPLKVSDGATRRSMRSSTTLARSRPRKRPWSVPGWPVKGQS